jgi:sialate O-acetylesterase
MCRGNRRLRALTAVSLLSTWFAAAACLSADVKPHALISDNMVLQQGMENPVWGTAEPGEMVTVAVAGQTAKAAADKTGSWMVRLSPMKAGGPHEMTVAGKNTVKISNVMVGEVWLCSGQSNMNMGVGEAMNAQEEIAKADYPNLRLFQVHDKSLPEPVKDVDGRWRPCSPQSAGEFSAAGYYFGRHLQGELNVPVGLVLSAHGASPAEAWTEAGALKACIPDAVERWETVVKKYEAAKAEYDRKVPAGSRPSPQPALPREGSWIHHPTGFWNGAIAPLVPYGMRGVIWYQGESNVPRAMEYRKLLPTMIQSWRKEWGQGDFPFLIVSVAPYLAVRNEPTESKWAELREAQWMTAENDPHSGLADTSDIGDAKSAHPMNKQEVGRRLALIALAKTYGRDVVYSGPMYASMKVEGDKVRLSFNHVHGGLVAKPEAPLKGFAVAGKDRQFVWAQAKIDGDTVVVWNDEIHEPAAVRYAWANNPVCNLFNVEGLPAVPFRTDDWGQRARE